MTLLKKLINARIMQTILIISLFVISTLFIYDRFVLNNNNNNNLLNIVDIVDDKNDNNNINNIVSIPFGAFIGIPFYYKKSGYNKNTSNPLLSITTICDLKYLYLAQRIAMNFNGPISISIYFESQKNIISNSNIFIEYFSSINNKYDINVAVLYPNYSSSYYQHFNFKNARFVDKFPVNSLRNLAAFQVNTKYTFYIDVDFIYISNTINLINDGYLNINDDDDIDTQEKKIWIVPSFEFTSKQYDKHSLLMNKEELLSLILNNKIIPFKSQENCINSNVWYECSNDYNINYCGSYQAFFVINTIYAAETSYNSDVIDLANNGFEFQVSCNMFIIRRTSSESDTKTITNTNMIKNDVSKLSLPYYILLNSNLKINTVYHCINLIGEGLGNRLAQYWLSISFAYFNNLNWELINDYNYTYNKYQIHCPKTTHPNLKYFYSSQYWTYYLPKKLNFYDTHHHHNKHHDEFRDIMNIYINENVQKEMTTIDGRKIVHAFQYPFWQKILIFVMNKIFLENVYIPNTKVSFLKFDRMQYESNMNKIIIIHFRCGDLLNGCQGSWGYGFFGLSVIEEAFKHWGLHQIDNKYDYTIYLVTNGISNKNRIIDAPYIEKCLLLINKISNFMSNHEKYKKFKIKLISDGSLNDDMYRMSNTKYLICGYSTFCYYSAFANTAYVAFVHKIDDINFTHYKQKNILPPNYLPIKQITKFNVKYSNNNNNKSINYLLAPNDTNKIYDFFISH